ncbi:hypothetical protein LR48_Vigan11g036800 [Vigna angularis]|uniref:Uncharacterized protein n=1 Tax=Phaseolus angularis TaxID=3914 RepID=A0A0L9VQJ1_PHAAN|nr:hypothetical protein LR48_Vigan11g036800 [Vigna angularis]
MSLLPSPSSCTQNRELFTQKLKPQYQNRKQEQKTPKPKKNEKGEEEGSLHPCATNENGEKESFLKLSN